MTFSMLRNVSKSEDNRLSVMRTAEMLRKTHKNSRLKMYYPTLVLRKVPADGDQVRQVAAQAGVMGERHASAGCARAGRGGGGRARRAGGARLIGYIGRNFMQKEHQ